ncbi:MAG: hypothetical protein IEMM0008_1488 [bacterium]|nr:MAG: hypothetical protein IEMM0008_1488 [bacterium]
MGRLKLVLTRSFKLVLVIGLLFLAVLLIFYAVGWIGTPYNYKVNRLVLQKNEDQIKELKADIHDIESSMDQYYSQKKQKRPLYPILDQVKSGRLNDLIQEKFVLQIKLADQYNQIGDYYLNERYLTDKNGPKKYKLYGKHGRKIKELKYYLKNSKPLGEKILQVMIDTRIKALNNYNLSTEALGDISSSLYRLKRRDPVLIFMFNPLANLTFTKRLDELGREIYKNKAFRKKYLAEKVNSKVHHRKGKIYRQLAYLGFMVETYFSRLDDQVRKKLMESFFRQNKKVHRLLANYQDLQKIFLRQAEKELLIALGSDAKNTKITYDLAELNVYRYEHIVENKSEFLLANSRTLISSFTESKEHSILTHGDTVKSLFLLARIYYLMAYLEKDQYHRLQISDGSFVGSLKTPKDLRLHYLNKSRSIYEHKLLAVLPDGARKKTKSLYEKANANYLQVKREIYKLSPGR